MSVERELRAAETLWELAQSGEIKAMEISCVTLPQFLAQHEMPCKLRKNPVLSYKCSRMEVVSRTFETEDELLASFKGEAIEDSAFGGTSAQRFRYDAMYPEPLENDYIRTVGGLNREDLNHVSLLASDGWSWSGWHIDSRPGGNLISQLQRGRKLWFFATARRVTSALCGPQYRGSKMKLEKGRSVPSTMLDDLITFENKIKYCIQSPGDVVMFSPHTAHAVLSGPGLVSLLTTGWEVSEVEAARVSYLAQNFSATGSRKIVKCPGSRKRTRGKRPKRT